MIECNKASPCLTCKKTKRPSICTGQDCEEWKAWFVERWENTTAALCRYAVPYKVERGAIFVGGYRYSHPDTIRRFLANNPCEKCDIPESLCRHSCGILKRWEEMKEKAVKK